MKKVLVIEDNRDNLLLITLVLEQAGYEIINAETGEEGVEIAARESLFFILMDINLPGIDGLEATKRIRNSSEGKGIPIIAITSYAMLGDRERIMEAGVNGYLEKPIDPFTIMDEIHKIIGVEI